MSVAQKSDMQSAISDLMDNGAWGTYQKIAVACTAAAIILDGLDNQLLGTAIPSLMNDWKMERSAFATPLAMSPLGMLIGGAIGGWLGDRSGRRVALLMSVLLFSLPTAAIYFANDVFVLGLLRFLAGLGLGGAMPNATALTSEYVPRRYRPIAVTLTIVCVPVGAMLAAFLSSQLLPTHGWRYLFLVGGSIPVHLAFLLYMLLPESPRFLARDPRRTEELTRLLQKFGHSMPASDFKQANDAERTQVGPALSRLFGSEFRRDTLAVATAFFFCLLAVYMALQLIVTALHGIDISIPDANQMLAWWNIGGIAGALIGAIVIQRVGSKLTMLVLTLIALAISTGVAIRTPTADGQVVWWSICIVLGALINAVQVALYSLAAHVFPTELRGRGIGAVLAMGRTGNILAAYVGVAALNKGGISYFFAAMAICMAFVAVSLSIVRRHIPATRF